MPVQPSELLVKQKILLHAANEFTAMLVAA